MSDFAANLRLLTSERRSVSQICREIGINRQQFSRYLNGTSLPSAHNLRRICAYFGLAEAELMAPQAAFRAMRCPGGGVPESAPWRSLVDLFPGNLTALRRHIGLYHSHFISPSFPGTVVRGLVQLREEDGYVRVRTLERGRDSARGAHFRARYDGLAALRGEWMFLLEWECFSGVRVAETVLFAGHRRNFAYLTGLTLGVSWRPRHEPFASRMIWKRLAPSADIRKALGDCGTLPRESRELDPVVRGFLGHTAYPAPDDPDGGAFF